MKPNNHDFALQHIESELQKNYYVQVPFAMPENDITAAIEAYFAFLQLPDHIKEHIQGTIAPQHRRGDIGFKQRDPSEHIYNDSKEFFHYHPVIFERYADFLNQHPAVANFVNKAQPIWELADKTVKSILKAFDGSYSNVYDQVYDCKEPHLVLRFLRYNWATSGKYLAKPHFDAGSFTLAIAESCPGLRIGSCPEDLKPVEHHANKAIFMLSSNFQKLMPNDKLKAGWHDVIQTDDSLIGKPFARWALVAFIEGHSVDALPRSETHKWVAGHDNITLSDRK